MAIVTVPSVIGLGRTTAENLLDSLLLRHIAQLNFSAGGDSGAIMVGARGAGLNGVGIGGAPALDGTSGASAIVAGPRWRYRGLQKRAASH
jgi:hypothetical protein